MKRLDPRRPDIRRPAEQNVFLSTRYEDLPPPGPIEALAARVDALLAEHDALAAALKEKAEAYARAHGHDHPTPENR